MYGTPTTPSCLPCSQPNSLTPAHLDTGQLRVLDLVSVQQRLLLLLPKNAVVRHQHVLRNVNKQLVFRELLDVQLGHEVQKALLCEGREVGGDDHDGS